MALYYWSACAGALTVAAVRLLQVRVPRAGLGVTSTDKTLVAVSLLRAIPRWQRLDVLPFACLYAASLLDAVLSLSVSDRVLACAIASFAAHAVCALVQQWFPLARCAAGFSTVDALADATFVLVVPREHHGASALCALCRPNPALAGSGASGGSGPFSAPSCWFVFQLTKYEALPLESGERVVRFAPLQLPDRLPLRAYVDGAQRGHATPGALAAARAKWGANSVEVPIPTYRDIAKEHVVAPFFVVQIVSVALWCLDEYWGMPLMTLCMLVFVEHMNIRKRLKTLAELAAMARRAPSELSVYRAGEWRRAASAALVPGDLVLVKSKAGVSPAAEAARGGAPAQFICPCDLLVLRGECIVNEALLTGESVPQTKVSVLLCTVTLYANHAHDLTRSP